VCCAHEDAALMMCSAEHNVLKDIGQTSHHAERS